MTTDRDALVDHLAVHGASDLEAVIEAAGVARRGAESPRELAERLVDAVWWNATTPLGYVTDRSSFEDIVDDVVVRLGMEHTVANGTVWRRLESLTGMLALDLDQRGVGLDDLDSATRAKLMPTFWPQLLGISGSAGALSAGRLAANLLKWTGGPVGRLLPYVPYIGPWVKVIRAGSRGISVVAGPLGVALAVVSINQSLGANYHRLVPLILGIGALGAAPVEEAVEI